MEGGELAVLSKQSALNLEMNVIAGNLAASGVHGYKSEKLAFTSHLHTVDGHTVSFVVPKEVYRDFESGAFAQTHNSLDIMIQGPGFFAVQTPRGVMYTRCGRFKTDPNNNLVTADGNNYPVLDQGNAPVNIPPSSNIFIAEDGTISVGENNAIVGQLVAWNFQNPNALTKGEGGLFVSSQEKPEVNLNASFIQGGLETSNTNTIMETVRMMEVLRNYQHLQHLLDKEHERNIDSTRKLISV